MFGGRCLHSRRDADGVLWGFAKSIIEVLIKDPFPEYPQCCT